MSSKPPLPPHETLRLRKLGALRVLDTPAEQAFDAFAELAAFIARTPTALVSFVDRDRQWFKARFGFEHTETPRAFSFCAHALVEHAPLIVQDARKDPRFSENPLVTGAPSIAFYAGFPLRTPEGHVLGTLCVLDYEPRKLAHDQIAALTMLASRVEADLELRGLLVGMEASVDPAPLAPSLEPEAAESVASAPLARPDLQCRTCSVMVAADDCCSGCGAPLPDPRLIGAVLGAGYRIEELLGVGGVAQVYRAVALDDGAPVAVKLLLPRWITNETVRARFAREIEALTRLRHPRIVSVRETGTHGQLPYLVMELLSGSTLADVVLAGGRPMAITRALQLCDDILEAVEFAHSHGIVHRDVKPENIVLTTGDRAKLIDFGIASVDKALGQPRLTQPDDIQGTPYYMSPEQCLGGDAGPAADVYAVGVVLYEMLCGSPPFIASSVYEVMRHQQESRPPPLAAHGARRAVPPEVERIAQWALTKRAAERPTATQLRSALSAVLARMQVSPVSSEAAATEPSVAADLAPRDPAAAVTRQGKATPATEPSLIQRLRDLISRRR